jgi:hypothetical protein
MYFKNAYGVREHRTKDNGYIIQFESLGSAIIRRPKMFIPDTMTDASRRRLNRILAQVTAEIGRYGQLTVIVDQTPNPREVNTAIQDGWDMQDAAPAVMHHFRSAGFAAYIKPGRGVIVCLLKRTVPVNEVIAAKGELPLADEQFERYAMGSVLICLK